jgi:hypothetical protein
MLGIVDLTPLPNHNHINPQVPKAIDLVIPQNHDHISPPMLGAKIVG